MPHLNLRQMGITAVCHSGNAAGGNASIAWPLMPVHGASDTEMYHTQ